MCSSKRATRRKYHGACITAIDDKEIVMLDQAKEKFAELCAKKVESFKMILAWEPKPSKAMTRRAYNELELPDFDLDDNLGEDYFAPGEDLEGNSSMTSSQKTVKFGTDYVPAIGTKISKDFGSKGYFEGEVVLGPHNVTIKGDNVLFSMNMVVWKVRYKDGDREEMTLLTGRHQWKRFEFRRRSRSQSLQDRRRRWRLSRLGIDRKN